MTNQFITLSAQNFPLFFSGDLGLYTGPPMSSNLNPTIQPIRLKPHRVLFVLRPKIDKQLDKLIVQGVLEPIPHACWETSIVTPVKPEGFVQICADYKGTLNKALQQYAYPILVMSHLLTLLAGSKIFKELDLT